MGLKDFNIELNGWIKTQLEVQKNGLFGSLDKVWKDIKDSKWIGGKEEGWERFPYYLNGLVPLAYALNDEELIDKANHYMDVIITAQREDGKIACPAHYVLLRVPFCSVAVPPSDSFSLFPSPGSQSSPF